METIPTAERLPLDCRTCQAFCCKVGGHVPVTRADIARLAAFLGISLRDFAKRHLVKAKKRGLYIKLDHHTCQFLGADRYCSVYEARPEICRTYHCWNDPYLATYDFASFAQLPVVQSRQLEVKLGAYDAKVSEAGIVDAITLLKNGEPRVAMFLLSELFGPSAIEDKPK